MQVAWYVLCCASVLARAFLLTCAYIYMCVCVRAWMRVWCDVRAWTSGPGRAGISMTVSESFRRLRVAPVRTAHLILRRELRSLMATKKTDKPVAPSKHSAYYLHDISCGSNNTMLVDVKTSVPRVAFLKLFTQHFFYFSFPYSFKP